MRSCLWWRRYRREMWLHIDEGVQVRADGCVDLKKYQWDC